MEDDLESQSLLPTVGDWTARDVEAWLVEDALTREFADALAERAIDGPRLLTLRTATLVQMGVVDTESQRQLLQSIASLMIDVSFPQPEMCAQAANIPFTALFTLGSLVGR